MGQLIYVADDEKNIRELIQQFLVDAGYEVEIFETGDQLLLRFLEQEADVIILDVMMPGNDGFQITQKLRQRSAVPIILLTAKDTDSDYLTGFNMGADDYFTKPFSPLKLTLRVKAILDRQSQQETERSVLPLSYQGLILSENQREAVYKGSLIKLTNTEYELLTLLMTYQENAVSREQLLSEVWGYEADVETRVTDDTIKRLRKKLREVESSVQIETVWGYGFKLTTI